MHIETAIREKLPNVVELRHRLHQIPELGYEEFETASMIRAELRRLNIDFVEGVENASTATIAWIGDVSKPCIALRADIDALPIVEKTGLPYASHHAGCMHACGHDGHTATLLGTAALLRSIEAQLGVCVKFIWQPAEEGGGGAERLCDAGVLDGRIGPKVAAIFGLHGWPSLPVGTIATRPGELLAATDTFTVDFKGVGCHAAFPHMGRDPIITACEAVVNLQQFVSREMDPTDSAVITIGMVHAGTATNVIPETATIGGTARTLNDASRRNIEASIRRRCEAIAKANDCTATVNWLRGYPPTLNEPAMADYVAAVAKRALGTSNYLPAARPVMGGEDFAYYAEQVPGCFFFVGVQPRGMKSYPSLHNERYDFTDDALSVGMRMFVELVMGWGS